MTNETDRKGETSISLPNPSASDLRGRQSVRATFKLSSGCIEAINIVAAHLGIKQKSLFDHLVEDIQLLKTIAREVQNAKVKKRRRVQKTYVISRKSLCSLDEVSKSFKAPRDALVEYSVQRLLPIITQEKEKHERRKQMLEKMIVHYKEGLTLLKQVGDGLGKEDPVYSKLEAVMSMYESANRSIDSYIDRGSLIEGFDPSIISRLY